MSEVFVARQPIFDRRLQVAGYELLFRGNAEASMAGVTDDQTATATVLLNTFTEIGLEQLVGATTAWLNVSREFVLAGFARTVPPGAVVLEILEDQEIDDELIAAVSELTQAGYRLALDDYACDPDNDPLIAHVELVKLDLMALGREAFAIRTRQLLARGITVVAEKIETHAEYEFCRRIGCHLFQGYFFCRPQLVQSRHMDANRLSLLELLSALQDPAIDLPELERTIATDIGLSNRLLRYINSAFFGLRQQVRSINQAVTLLGIENLKRWASLSVFASISEKPAELTVTALVRARFCELAGPHRRGTSSGSELFTLGLFSVIDALMDTPIEELLAQLPFPQDMRDALAAHVGDDGALLDCVAAVEAGDFTRAEGLLPNAGELYLESLRWANRAATLL